MTESGRPIVCIVDDDSGIRESLCFLLEDAGYEVEEAADGAAALRLLRTQARPRVMLLDRMMSRLDGVQTLRALDDEPGLLERTGVLFMTARSEPPEPEIAELLQRTTMATVSKPFNLDVLLSAVELASKRLAERFAGE